MQTDKKRIELYVVMLYENDFQYCFKTFYCKSEVLKYLKVELNENEFQSLDLVSLIRALDKGIKTVHLLSFQRRLFIKGISYKSQASIKEWSNGIIRNYLEQYFKTDFAQM